MRTSLKYTGFKRLRELLPVIRLLPRIRRSVQRTLVPAPADKLHPDWQPDASVVREHADRERERRVPCLKR